jgi:hypothetical protein
MPKLVTDEEAARIEREVDAGMRGPVVVKWIRQLLDDREERIRMAKEQKSGG